ncbi:MAG: hypothetical protein ACLR1V_10960 [Coprococcus sp.]
MAGHCRFCQKRGIRCHDAGFAVAFSKLMDVFNGGEIIGTAITSVLSSPQAFIFVSIIVMSIGMMFMNPIAIASTNRALHQFAASFGIDPMVYGAGIVRHQRSHRFHQTPPLASASLSWRQLLGGAL